MNPPDLVALVHLVGFATGIALYGMLAVMIWRGARSGAAIAPGGIPLLAAVLGLVWNAGALVVFGWHDFGLGDLSPWYTALAYIALGFLPAVVVDSATRTPARASGPRPLAIATYALSAIGGLLQAVAVIRQDALSSNGLIFLTIGYGLVIVIFAVSAWRRHGSFKMLTAVALAAFAVSALHLSHHSSTSDSWPVELIGHHASLPLVLVILYQDYRFALADLFLKRALSVLTLVAVAVAGYVLLIAPVMARDPDTLRISVPGALLSAWVATALLYPLLRGAVHRFVDRVVLHRTDYRVARRLLARALSSAETPNEALDAACSHLRSTLSAATVRWTERADLSRDLHAGALATPLGPSSARVLVPTADAPAYDIEIDALAAGRRLMSDDIALLETAAMLVARRIDELRVSEERFERDMRENDMRRLASEAELRALRAQLNPHFLFNALNTIGHLITKSPTRAVDTLYQLTALLRAVLRRTGDFVSLDEELELVDAYLAIEQTRFEERLHIVREVPALLGELLVPPLILQPIVENAVKHGISPVGRGGTVRLEARLTSESEGKEPRLCLIVRDDGRGATAAALAPERRRGVGLTNVESRLVRYYGTSGELRVTSEPGRGTTVELFLGVRHGAQAHDETLGAVVHADDVAAIP